MKTLSTSLIAATGLSLSTQAEGLSVSSTVGFESVYAFRGSKQANEIFQSAVDVAYGDFYSGI